MENNYSTRISNKLKVVALLALMMIAGASSSFASGYIVGSGSVSCGGTGYYNFYSWDSNLWCLSINWSVSRPDGTTGYYFGPSIAASMGNTPGTAYISASGWCDPIFGGGFGTFCSGAYITSVGSGTLPTPGSISGSSSLCNNSSSTYSISSVSGASNYTWTVPSGWKINGSSITSLTTSSTSISVTAPSSGSGSGQVRVRANGSGCTGSSAYRSRTVSYGARTPSIIGPSSISANSIWDYFVSGSYSSYSWTVPSSWSVFGGTTSSSIIVSPQFAQSGNITVTTVSCGVTRSASKYVTVNNGGCDGFEPCIQPYRIGNEDLPAGVEMSVFPNPTAEIANVRVRNGRNIQQIKVYNQLQQLVFEATPGQNQVQLDLSSFDNGVYFVEVNDGIQDNTSRVMVQH